VLCSVCVCGVSAVCALCLCDAWFVCSLSVICVCLWCMYAFLVCVV